MKILLLDVDDVIVQNDGNIVPKGSLKDLMYADLAIVKLKEESYKVIKNRKTGTYEYYISLCDIMKELV